MGCHATPAANQIGDARPRGSQQGAKALVRARHSPDELTVSLAAAGPSLFDRIDSLVQVGGDSHDRSVGSFNLVDLVDPPHRDFLGKVEPELAKGPFQPGPVEQQVRAAVETKALALEPGGEAADMIGGLDQAHTAAQPRQAKGRGQTSHPGPDDDHAPIHRGCLKPSSHCMARRSSRNSVPSGFKGGKACASISGTNRLPRPLPQT